MPHPRKNRRQDAEPIPPERERFAMLLHSMVLRFGSIHDDIERTFARMREEWQKARGLATLTEERLESVESRIARLEAKACEPQTDESRQLRGLLANYGPSLDAIGVRPEKDSAAGDAR